MYLGILVYTIIWLIACGIIRINYRMNKRFISQNEGLDFLFVQKNKKKLSILSAIVVSGLFTLFNVYATKASNVIGSDRQNYIYNFDGFRETPSFGLSIIIKTIRQMGGSIETLFYFTTFVCVFITLIAYRNSKNASPYSFFLLCITQYFLCTLTALKQSYASAFAVVFFVLILEYDTRKSRTIALLCAIIACLFHPSGYILFFVWIAIGMKKTKKSVTAYFIVLFILGVLFKHIMPIAAALVKPISSSLSNKILEYFSENGEVLDEGTALGFLKGIPYYVIAILGIKNRRSGKKQIEHYDSYLIVVVTGAFLYLVSFYNAWFSRFVYLFCFVSFVFLEQMMKLIRKDNRLILKVFVQGSLFAVTYRFLYLIYSLYGGF